MPWRCAACTRKAEPAARVGRLLERDDSLLLVIDAQPGFYGAGPSSDAEAAAFTSALARAAWLAAVATALHVPAVVTEEDAERNGPTADAILAALGHPTVFAKTTFGAADQPDILAAIEASGRRSAILVGLETDVCVAHSALGLLDRGFRVAVVDDATYAPGSAHHAGWRRVAGAGAQLIHAKGVYYEWLRTLDAARAFERDHPELTEPPGFCL